MLKPAESRYSKIEQACLALVFLCGWEAPSLPPVWEGSFDHEVWSDQAYVEATGPLLRLSEFDITCTSRKAMKGQAIADLLAEYPVEDSTDLFYWWSCSTERKERGYFSDSWRQRKQNQTANDLTIESLHLVDSLSANGNLCLSICLSSHRGWDWVSEYRCTTK